MSAYLQEIADGDLYTDSFVMAANHLRKAIDWLERTMSHLPHRLASANGLYMAHSYLSWNLRDAQDHLARTTAPWFEVDQGRDAWWGFDPFDYECWNDAVEGMQNACGWVRIRGFHGAVWFGPDVHSVDDLEEEDLPPRLSELVGAEVDRQLAERGA